MSAIRVVQVLLSLYAFFWAAYLLAMPLAGRLRRSRATVSASKEIPDVIVIVPAHNMAGEIDACIAAIHASDFAAERLDIHVIADHCTDDTAGRARAAGARVHERGEMPPGKTYAIAWALKQLASDGFDPDLYLITDATARLDRGFLRSLAEKWRTGEDVVVGHAVVSSANMQWFARCLGLTLVHRNHQNAARERLGLSSLIEGRGMAYSRSYIRRFGWSLALPTQAAPGQHPTEDWRHGVRVVESGLRVAYEDDARVFTPLRGDLGAATRQGIRWERGRQLNAITHGLRLLRDSIGKRDRLRFFAALDSIQLPVAVLGVFSVAVAVLTWALPANPPLDALGYAPVALLAIYGLQVTWRGRADGISPITVAWAPVYLLWRLSAFLLAWMPVGRASVPRKQN